MIRSFFFLMMFLINFCYALYAQEVTVRALLDTNRALIGDQLNLNLSVEQSAPVRIDFPLISDTLTADIEVIYSGTQDTSELDDGRQLINQQLIISVFDTGYFRIPPLHFVMHSGQMKDTLSTLPVYFEIASLQLDSTIRDIKALERVPVGFRDIAPYLCGLIVLGILTWLLIRYVNKRKSTIYAKQEIIPAELPEVTALRELNRLKEEQPWKHQKVKQYHIRLSEILRTYIESRFGITAMEQTTEDIMMSFRTIECDKKRLNLLRDMLGLSDLVKFAKAIPSEKENAVQVEYAIEYVNGTTPEITANMDDKNTRNSTIIKENA